MEYNKYLASILDNTYCPFCSLSKNDIVEERKYFYVILARAPYCEDHLLIIPKRHVILLKEMRWREKREVQKILQERTERLETQHEGVSVLLRNGYRNGKIGKSVDHLHIHLIPDLPIGSENGDGRIFLSNAEYHKQTKYLKKQYL